jgi:hypothetical protein
MTLLLSDMINEFHAREFFNFEGYGESLLILSVPNPADFTDCINTIVEFHDEMVSPSAMVLEVDEAFYLTAVEVCNTLNSGTRWYKHFVQETPEGKLQVCIAADYIARELGSDRCFDLLMSFCNHVYDVKRFLMQAE